MSEGAFVARDDDSVPRPAVSGSRRVPADIGPGVDTGRRARRRRRGPLGLLRALGVFYRQVIAELRKVIWPTRKELITYTTVVLVFVVVMVLIVSALDFAFSQAVLKVFGGSSTAAK